MWDYLLVCSVNISLFCCRGMDQPIHQFYGSVIQNLFEDLPRKVANLPVDVVEQIRNRLDEKYTELTGNSLQSMSIENSSLSSITEQPSVFCIEFVSYN